MFELATFDVSPRDMLQDAWRMEKIGLNIKISLHGARVFYITLAV